MRTVLQRVTSATVSVNEPIPGTVVGTIGAGLVVLVGVAHEDTTEIAHAMAATRLIDYISVIGSGADTHNLLANCMPPMA